VRRGGRAEGGGGGVRRSGEGKVAGRGKVAVRGAFATVALSVSVDVKGSATALDDLWKD
jgi:hypothetical protein